MRDAILKDAKKSKQLVDEDFLNPDGTIEPFINFKSLLEFYYDNVYHQRSIKIKAALLSQVDQTTLDKHLPKGITPKEFLYALCIDLELYGNAFLEKSGESDFYLHNILGYQGRVDRDRAIYQVSQLNQTIALDGFHLKYYSPNTKYYGEPDYLASLRQIITSTNADKYNTSFFENGARPGFGVIFENSSPNPDQIATFKEFFGSNYKGYENAHKTLLLHTGKTAEGSPPAKVRLEKLDSIEDMSFEKLKDVNRNEIIASHGVPPRLVGVMSAGGLGGGTELIDQLHSFNEIIIKPKIAMIEEFLKNIGIEHKVKPLDVTNFKDDSSLISNLVDKQIISALEAKELLGFNNKVK